MNMAVKFFLSLRCSLVKMSRIAPSSRLDKEKIASPIHGLMAVRDTSKLNFCPERLSPAIGMWRSANLSIWIGTFLGKKGG